MANHLHVCGVAYEHVVREMDDCGSIEESTQQVCTREGLGVEAETMTLAHELMHAFYMASGVRDDHDERVIEAVARQWVAFHRDPLNAWFVERLVAGAI